MKLDRVTITGADNSIRPFQLVALSEEFPFVEWGILLSRKQAGGPRFPDMEWLEILLDESNRRMQLSLHVCGRYLRDLMLGINDIPPSLLESFQRLQLNFHGEEHAVQEEDFLMVLAKDFGEREIIFQIDGNRGGAFLRLARSAVRPPYDAVPLFDRSHGAGVLPDTWPSPLFDSTVYHGYAGGLGPENLHIEIPRIAQAAGDARFWIDMETKVRSETRFDLDLVRAALVAAKPFVTA